MTQALEIHFTYAGIHEKGNNVKNLCKALNGNN